MDPVKIPIFSLNYFLSVSASIPGSFPCSINSRAAPPPVERWVKDWARWSWLIAETESPPPTIRGDESFDREFGIDGGPLAKEGISNTPTGPFQKKVFAFANSVVQAFTVSGPISTPCQPGGIPS